MRKLVLCILLVAGALSCSYHVNISSTSKNARVDTSIQAVQQIEQFIVPYRDSLALQMEIGRAHV